MVEEIKIDFSNPANQGMDLALFRYIMDRAKSDGPQMGIPWNKEVYNYIFESEIALKLESLLGYEIVDVDLQERV